jgi:hypothetical protein
LANAALLFRALFDGVGHHGRIARQTYLARAAFSAYEHSRRSADDAAQEI